MKRFSPRLAAVLLATGLCGSGQAADAAVTSPSPPGTVVSSAGTRVRSFDDRHSSIRFSGTGWTTFDPGAGWHGGTAKSSTVAKDFFEYTNATCTRLKWFSTKSNSRGKAEVYVDGELKATVDTYSPTNQTASAVFDSGELPLGGHAIKVVVLRQKSASATDYWVECDKVEVATTQTWPSATALPSPAPLPDALIKNDGDGSVLYFGNWDKETEQAGFHARNYRASHVQFNTCEFKFRGSAVRWIGSKNRDHGFADVYLDGVLQKTVDAYNPTWLCNVVLFEQTGLRAGPLHTLRIVVRKDRNPSATDCYQTVDCFEAVRPVNYVEEITKAMRAEYAQIGSGAKPYALPDTWRPVAYAAHSPETGVSLQAGVFQEALQRNIDYLNHCFASKTYSDGPGWFNWLPASNEGRLLQGAANALRWGERADLRNIVNTVVGRIQARQRADGYHNYYPEKDSFAVESGANSERKNYDRVFWTRGLLDAGRAGNVDAYAIVRKFYDWFNACSYLPRMIHGDNSPNGFPGGPLVHLSPVGKSNDLIVSERYFDQDWWLNELKNSEPLCFTFYPGERPHCYDLLGLEAYIDQYRATGARKYLNAVLGGWAMYRENLKHVGGTTAICESRGPYPPKSCKLTSGCTGETCGSVFWANINSRLMQLYPAEEEYTAEIEEAIYNVVLACQHTNGYIRYHNPLHEAKDKPQCQGTCCECSVVGMLSKLPEYIYSTDKDGLWVNLYAASAITWNQGGSSVAVTQATSFPFATTVSLTVSSAQPATMNIRIRVPSWGTGMMDILVNGERAVTGTPGSYASIRRQWANDDVIRFTLPMGFTTVKYTGLDQVPDNVDRYALLRGPILMALNDANGQIHADAAALPGLLSAVEGSPLQYEVKGTTYRFVPYWQVAGSFTCFPMVQPWAGPMPVGLVAAQAASAIRVEDLHCEYLKNPLGLDTPQPRLSWVLSSEQRAQRQTAYRVLVAASLDALAEDRGDLWDSGKVASDQSIHVEYAGQPLASRQQCFWKVRAWDTDGKPSAWSAPARWEMGLLLPADWRAQWIRRSELEPKSDEDRFSDQPAPLFRKEFTVEKTVTRARAYVSGLGYYELRLNGQRVGDRVLDPGWTTYSKRVLYSTYDVTAQLRNGRNAVGIMLGNGWYNPLPLRMWGWLNLREHLAIGRPRVILQLAIDYADGTSQPIVTDTTWKTSEGPILRNNVYLGEVYDARREQPGWDEPNFPDANWETAVAATEPLGPLRAQSAPPIRVMQVVRPVQRAQPRPGTYIFDFGQNFAGWVTLRVKGPAGTAVRLRYGELLYPNGTLNAMTSVPGQVKGGGPDYVYPGSGAPRTAWQSDVYILKGVAEETYTPRFTFHGFRYVEVTGYPGEPPLTALEGLRLNSAVERVGVFACTNERFNQIQRMIEGTFLSNLFSVQSDCPHREKFGYGGDIAATSETFLLNYDMAAFYEKTVRDYADAVRPNGGMTETAPFVGIADGGFGERTGSVGWGTAFTHLQWQLYQYYGDRRTLEEHYPLTRSWIEFLRGHAKEHILDNGISDHESLAPRPRALTGTAFYFYNVHLLSRIARALGNAQDAEQYAAFAGEIKQAFNHRFLKRGTGAYDTATQACQAFALFFDLVPPEEKQNALQVLVRDILESHRSHLTTGIFGTRFLPLVLSDGGRPDVAYALANQKDFPGWGHMLECGATTIWEHWEFSDNTFSHNHPAFGSVGEWLFKSLAGIQPDPEMVGCDRLIIRPQPSPGLTWAKGEYRSLRGPVASAWRVESAKITLNVTIPPNATATVYVPAKDVSAVTESGESAAQAEGVKFLRMENGTAVFHVGSGNYRFQSTLPDAVAQTPKGTSR